MVHRTHDQHRPDAYRTITLRVRPGAPVTRRKPDAADGSWRVDIAAPSEDNKANLELIRFLSKELTVPKSSIEILSGLKGRRKVVRVMREL